MTQRFLTRGVRAKEQQAAEKMTRRAGYKAGGAVKHDDEAEDKALIGRVLREKGLAKKKGGSVPGKEVPKRLDRKRRADGGQVDGDKDDGIQKRASGGRVNKGPARVNVIVNTTGGGDDAGMQKGMALGAAMAAKPPMPAPAPPPMPPGGPGMIGGPPPGAMPPPGLGGLPMRKRGGRVADPIKPHKGGPETRRLPATVKVKGYERKKRGGCV